MRILQIKNNKVINGILRNTLVENNSKKEIIDNLVNILSKLSNNVGNTYECNNNNNNNRFKISENNTRTTLKRFCT
jgi:hypothetical protein